MRRANEERHALFEAGAWLRALLATQRHAGNDGEGKVVSQGVNEKRSTNSQREQFSCDFVLLRGSFLPDSLTPGLNWSSRLSWQLDWSF